MYPTSNIFNQQYGGEFPNAYNVFYSDFSDDPWQRASVSYPPSVDQPYYLGRFYYYSYCNRVDRIYRIY